MRRYDTLPISNSNFANVLQAERIYCKCPVLPGDRSNGFQICSEAFRIADGVNGTDVACGARLSTAQHRQFIFGLLGCYLLAPRTSEPGTFTGIVVTLIANEIPMSQLAR